MWKMLVKPALQSPDKHLFGPAAASIESPEIWIRILLLPILPQRQTNPAVKFVVDNLKTNLLGLLAIIAPQLAVRTAGYSTDLQTYSSNHAMMLLIVLLG